eukprot:scpid90016/ scgid6636/ 
MFLLRCCAIVIASSILSANGAEECGDQCTCSHDGDAYGCIRLDAPRGSSMECCSTGQSEAECNGTSSPLHPLPFCPYGACSDEGCVREPHSTTSGCVGDDCDGKRHARSSETLQMKPMRINQPDV